METGYTLFNFGTITFKLHVTTGKCWMLKHKGDEAYWLLLKDTEKPL